MPRSVVNLTPLLHIIGTLKMHLLFLLQGLLSVVFSVVAITPVSYVNLAIILLP
jgi:hypothetical protein